MLDLVDIHRKLEQILETYDSLKMSANKKKDQDNLVFQQDLEGALHHFSLRVRRDGVPRVKEGYQTDVPLKHLLVAHFGFRRVFNTSLLKYLNITIPERFSVFDHAGKPTDFSQPVKMVDPHLCLYYPSFSRLFYLEGPGGQSTLLFDTNNYGSSLRSRLIAFAETTAPYDRRDEVAARYMDNLKAMVEIFEGYKKPETQPILAAK
ncbi:hypothetical protein COV20_02705 [Candidatus Woesearchaeota archaeon CG10_big_fil_rev_8_21_14_0_10_45_16]|nr:MAG: hypothetical protein COV20_02705 [Candidatus Woesearchaeota archaeon CG10_big_fil_rev_8_21_14_0_10_45_16]